MRFVIVPNFANPYDQRMIAGLATAISELGHEAVPLPTPLSPAAIVALCVQTGADVLMQVNRFRPSDPALPKRIRHIAWFQDVFPHTGNQAIEGAREGDVVYALGDAGVLGLNVALPCYVGSLLTGVDPAILEPPKRRSMAKVDFSLCGFIPAPIVLHPNIKGDLVWYVNDFTERIPLIGTSWFLRRLRFRLLRRFMPPGFVPYALATTLRAVTEALYRPLRGELDINILSNAMYQEAALFVRPRKVKYRRRTHWSRRGRIGQILEPYRSPVPERNTPVDNLINHLARDYPRLLDRVLLIREALAVSRSLQLYGPGWETHDEFRPYHKGIIDDPAELLSVYRRSRINLANNTHGFGLHSRTLECMAVGGFIFTHTSPHDDKPGGMLTSFEPDAHYGAFTPENFRDQARRWLKDEEARVKVGERAAAVVRDKHLWHHRAQQILDDLKR